MRTHTDTKRKETGIIQLESLQTGLACGDFKLIPHTAWCAFKTHTCTDTQRAQRADTARSRIMKRHKEATREIVFSSINRGNDMTKRGEDIACRGRASFP